MLVIAGARTNTGQEFMKRSRGRNRRPGGNQQSAFNNPNRHFESVGPDVKIRGSAQQVLEKYQQYARDAHTSGDRVLSEAYFQYAEHYQRIVSKQTEVRVQQQGNPPQNRGGNGPRDDRDPRGGQDRDPRGGGDEATQSDDDRSEAEVVTPMSARRTDDEGTDSLRVIDAEDDRGDVEARDASPPEDRGDRNRKPRKPYRPREEGAAREPREERPAREPREDRAPREPREPRPPRETTEAVSETDGVMKTLARGRRKPAPEEGAPVEPTD
jgi:Domain of unknown function (DUF4167)